MPADDVVLAPPHTVLKTSSGKIRRAASREFYEHGCSTTQPAPVWWQVTRLTWTALRPQFRRVVQAAAGYLYGIYALACFFALGIPTWVATALLGRSNASRRVVHHAARMFFRLAGIPLQVQGLAHLPRTPGVLAINHTSYLDGVALFAALPPEFSAAFAAKRELAGHWLPRLFLRAIGIEFVERFDAKQGVEDIEQFMVALAAGRSPAFFPEGTLQSRAGLKPFRSGAFAVAVRAGVPVLPVVIRGARSVLRDQTWIPRHGVISVTLLPPLAPPGSDWEATVKLRDRVRGEILRACGEPDLAQ